MASPPPSSFSPGLNTTPTPGQSHIKSISNISLPSLDILPILVSILSRLKDPSASSSSSLPSASPAAATPSHPPTHTQSQSQSLADDTGSLDLKNLPTATDGVKAALARVRMQVATLPDMRRGVSEQELEIKELEAKVSEQRAVLEGLRKWARKGEEMGEGQTMEGLDSGE